jgi:hypothetical protein
MSDSSNGSTSSLALLAIDALTEFERVVDAVPAPGRGGAIGRLNPVWWTVLHVIRQADFMHSLATGEALDPWLVEHVDDERAPPFDDVRTALTRTRERLSRFCATATDEELERLSEQGAGVPLQQLLARTTAHLFAHAGELSTLASLVGAPDLGLPGVMRASRGLEAGAG